MRGTTCLRSPCLLPCKIRHPQWESRKSYPDPMFVPTISLVLHNGSLLPGGMIWLHCPPITITHRTNSYPQEVPFYSINTCGIVERHIPIPTHPIAFSSLCHSWHHQNEDSYPKEPTFINGGICGDIPFMTYKMLHSRFRFGKLWVSVSL